MRQTHAHDGPDGTRGAIYWHNTIARARASYYSAPWQVTVTAISGPLGTSKVISSIAPETPRGILPFGMHSLACGSCGRRHSSARSLPIVFHEIYPCQWWTFYGSFCVTDRREVLPARHLPEISRVNETLASTPRLIGMGTPDGGYDSTDGHETPSARSRSSCASYRFVGSKAAL